MTGRRQGVRWLHSIHPEKQKKLMLKMDADSDFPQVYYYC
jgi:hypothetical protein